MGIDLADKILPWYRSHGRQLPWRGNPDPYAVWVSEIMLQQTRVETAAPYYTRWMESFPTISDLAAASQQEVLQVWEGLGYYSRARNLHRAAQLVMSEFHGQLPSELAQLESLPGVGKYTAGALASIAFGQDQPALDANIRRVLARIFDISIPARSPEGERRLWELAREHLPPGQAGDFNQALMDLGATVCSAQKPACGICPVQAVCRAYEQGTQAERPVFEYRRAVPHYMVAAAILQQDGKVLIARRPEEGLLGGMWEFPGGKLEKGETLPQGLRREIKEELGVEIEVVEPFGIYQHAYTHFKVTLHAFMCRLLSGEPLALQATELRWVIPKELMSFPMGKIDRQIARKLQK